MRTNERRHRRPPSRVGSVAALALGRGIVALAAAWLLVLAVVPQQSWAEWLAHATGAGRVDADTLPPGDIPFAVAAGRDVTVTWAEAQLTSGAPVEGYLLQRYPATGTTPATMTSTCTGTVVGLSCVETGVPPGVWRYTVTPVQGGWLGGESGYGAAVTVGDPSLTFTSPTTIPVASLPVTLNGTLSHFLDFEPISFHLDSETGPALGGSPGTAGPGGGGSVSVTIPSGVSDAPHSVFVVGTGGSVASAAFSVVDPPDLTTLQAFDVDKDGKVDRVVATFDETLATPYTAGTTGWTLANVPSGATLASVAVAGNAATLTLNEGPGAPTTAMGAFTVALTPTSGGIRDLNGHRSSFAATAPADRAAPAPVNSPVMQDVDADGRVDRVTVTWSEALAAYGAGNGPWSLAGVPSGGSLASVTSTTGATTTTLTLNEGAGALDTAVGPFTVSLAASGTGIRDAAGNLTSFAPRSPLDGARPVLIGQSGLDVDANGRFDRVDVTFSEALGSYAPSTGPWSMTGAPGGASLGSVSLAGAVASLHLVEGGTVTTAVGSWRVALVANAAGVADPAGNQASYSSTLVGDGAAPAVVTMTMLDASGRDGFVDRVDILFSEALSGYGAGTAPWALADVPSGSVLTNATRRGSTTIRLTLGAPTGAPDTGVGAFTVALAAHPSGVRDAAGNLTSFGPGAPGDGARPIPVALSGTGGAVPGRIEPGDTLSVLLSEPLGAGVALAADTTVTLRDPNGGGSDRLTVPGLFSGERSTGSNGYITTNNRVAGFAASPLSLSPDRRTVTVTVGPSCSGNGCGSLGTAPSAGNVSTLLDPSLLDDAGNLPLTAARNISFRLF